MKKIAKHFSFLTTLVALFALLTVAAYADETPKTPDVVFAPETQLVVYVDNQWSDTLSGTYGFGDTAVIEAPEESGNKTFSHWTADGSIVSYANPLKLTTNAHTTLYAVYANAAPEKAPVAGFTSVTRTNDGSSISFQAIADGTVTGAGIVYSTTATGDALTVGGTGVTNEAAVKSADLNNTLPKSILDSNNCWMLQITPTSADTVYHARAYVTVGETTTYGDVKTVKLSDLSSGVSLVANLDGLDPENSLDSALKDLTISTVTYDPNGGTGTTTTQAFAGSSGTLKANTFTRSGYRFMGWSTTKNGSVRYSDRQTVSNLSGDLTLYAVWDRSVAYSVTFKVVNGSWDDGTSNNKTVTLSGYASNAPRLSANQIPAVGTKPDDTFKAGSWNVTPSAGASITGNTTYTYTYAQKDSISHTVTFKVSNGSWDDETTGDKNVTLSGYEGDTLKLAETDIPAVGTKPEETYKAGRWDVTPVGETEITEDTVYTYIYVQKDSVIQVVTFRVVNGSWDDETTGDKTVTLTGHEGDTLKLAETDIPTVGTKPEETFKAGSWDVTPDPEAAITEDTIYTYTYVPQDSVSVTVTFRVVNGSWDDETTEDKTVTLYTLEGEPFQLAENQIPAVGTKPDDTYKTGDWDTTPDTETELTADTTYTYTYAQKDSISATVTFHVENGSWNNDTTADKTVTLSGYEGDALKLAAGDIPAVGAKPDESYQAGSWDTTPDTETEITADTTYTYTYAAVTEPEVTPPAAKELTYDGTAQELVSAGTATGGTMLYSLTEDGAYAEALPTGTDAGAYTVWYKVQGDGEYADVAARSVPVTITKAPHSDMTATQTVSVSRSGVTGAALNLSAYLADAASWSVKSTDGTLITSATKGDGAVLNYTAAQTAAASATGNVVLTVTIKNYADYTLTVNFRTAAAFTLRFESNGGTEIPSRILNENAAYGSLPTAAQVKRTGYTFGGWFTDAALNVPATAQTSIGSSDATVYAKWTVDSHTITLNLNGHGTLDKTAITYSAADSDFNLPVPADVTDGSSTWTFGGWQKGGTGAAQINVTIQTAALEDATYTALWVEGKKEGEVTFTKDPDADTGLMGLESMDEGTVSTEDAGSGTPAQTLADVMKEVACAESKAGEADKTVTVAMDVQPVNTNSSELAQETKTAIEKIKEKSGSGSDNKVRDDVLTIEVQKTTAPTSGTGEVTTEKLTDIGRVVEIPLQYNMTGRYQPRIFRFHDNVAAAFTRLATRPVSGFRDGTYFVSGFGASAVIYIYTEKFSTYSITTTETPTHTVMFETNGGTAIESVSVEDQMTLTQPTTPTKDSGDTMISYVFDGWYSNSDFSTVYDFSTKVTKDLTLYAKWREVIVYTITFNPNEGTVSPTSGTTNADGKLASLPTPTRSGYRFDGWYDALTGGNKVTADTVFTSNAEIYARWTKITNGGGNYYHGGGSSSSDDSSVSYPHTVNEPNHGTVRVTPTAAVGGSKVTITVRPDSGYEVDTVTVTDAKGQSVSVTKVNDTTYTFSQPESKVDIVVTFRQTAVPAPVEDVFDSFKDLDKDAWYREGVKFALENGIMSGMDDGTFAPNGTASRAMIAQILWNMEGKPAVDYAMSYGDVNADAWYSEAIRWATAEGIMGGYSDSAFGPEDSVTREQLAAILYRYAQRKGIDVSIGEETNLLSYDDATDVSDWAVSALQWTAGTGLITGRTTSTLNPGDTATRAEIATIMMRYCTEIA